MDIEEDEEEADDDCCCCDVGCGGGGCGGGVVFEEEEDKGFKSVSVSVVFVVTDSGFESTSFNMCGIVCLRVCVVD